MTAAAPAREVGLVELAERCEAASGSDLTLDAIITIALDPDRQVIVGEEPGRFPRKAIMGPISGFVDYAESDGKAVAEYLCGPKYTASLDAAVTLAPEGWFKLEPDSLKGWRALGLTGPWCHAATPALAVTAASLRARALQSARNS